MIVDNRPDPLIGNLFPLCSYEDYKQKTKRGKRLQLQQQLTSPLADSSVINTPIRRKVSGALASKIQTVVPIESPGQPRKYFEDSEDIDEVEMVNNSDDENTMQDIIQSSPARYDSVTPKTKDNSDWRVLRSISTNSVSSQQSIHIIKTTTTKTVNETLSSPPGTSPRMFCACLKPDPK